MARTVDDIEHASIRRVLSIMLFTRRRLLNKNQHIRCADLPKVEQGRDVFGDDVKHILIGGFKTVYILASRGACDNYFIKIMEDTSEQRIHLLPLTDVVMAVQVPREIDSTSSD